MKFKLFARLNKQPNKRPTVRPQQPQIMNKPATAMQNTNINPVPLDEVTAMTKNGLSEAEIIQILKEEGYDFNKIDEALNTILKTTVTGEVPPINQIQQNPNTSENQMYGHDFTNEQEFGASKEDFAPQNIPTQNPKDIEANIKEINEYNTQMEEIEDTVTALVDEKLGSIEDIKKDVETQFNSLTKELEQIKQQLSNEKTDTKTIENKEKEDTLTINTKINDIEPRLKALEKAFKDIIPNLIDNVRDIRERLIEKKDIPNTDNYIEPKHTKTETKKINNIVDNIIKTKKPQETINKEPKATKKDLFNI
ncbi:hypothetical protein GQ473_03915 [archaeon]|nr:hypothetical protein [archaeon]